MILLGVVLAALFVLAASEDEVSNFVSSLPQILGTFFAVIATLGIIDCGTKNETSEKLIPWVVALFAGLLLTIAHWSMAVILGLALIAIIVQDIILSSRRPPN